jgi:hypothetical protein
MTIPEQIEQYIASQPEPKQGELRALHAVFLGLLPGCRQWFLDGRDETGKVVTNPNIGYGAYTSTLAGGKTREFYQIGLSANTTGISVYVMGLKDKKYLADTYAQALGKASVTGYCIKFRSVKDIDVKVLGTAVQDGVKQTGIAS